MIVDLHSHTTASDGSLSPSELVARAVMKGVELFAITDHDTVSGLAEAQRYAQNQNIKLVPGIELSCRWEQKVDVHIVGLGFNPEDEQFLKRLTTQALKRQERGQKITTKLHKLGIEGADSWLAEQGFVTPGRPHVAKFLVAKGVVKNEGEAFKKYLAAGKSAYVSTDWCSVEEAIQWIADAGGVAVLAHPGKYKMTRSKLKRLVQCFASAGGHAIEVVSGNSRGDEVNALAGLANGLALKASVGSDFHRPGEAWQELGNIVSLPSSCDALWDVWS